MPIYFYWGDDDFAIAQATEQLRQKVIDPAWSSFNYEQVLGTEAGATLQALNQAMTPVFGRGQRLVWLAETTLCQQCAQEQLAELQRTLTAIPETSHLLLTASKKPDKRLKSTKLLFEHAHVREFSLIPPWKTDQLIQQVKRAAAEIGVKLSSEAVELMAESVGNDTRLLWNELEKLRAFALNRTTPLETDEVSALVNSNTQNSLQLATAIRCGDSARALGLVRDLLHRHEPALKIVATLVGQFRTWTLVKLAIASGETQEKIIAATAEVKNPKRIYFLRQEVRSLSQEHLLAAIPLLMDLEFALKRGADPLTALQTKVIELCQGFQTH